MQNGMCTYNGKDTPTVLQKTEFRKRKIHGKPFRFYIFNMYRTPQTGVDGARAVVAEHEVFAASERTRFEAAAHADRAVPIGGHGNDVYVIGLFGSFEFGKKMAVPRRPALISVLPVGCLFYINGSLSAATFITVTVLSLGRAG